MKNFLHHNLRSSSHNVLPLLPVSRSHHFRDIVDLPGVVLVGAHLLTFVAQPTIGEVFVVEREG